MFFIILKPVFFSNLNITDKKSRPYMSLIVSTVDYPV